jgi:dephospho-CoA kinase
VKVSESGPRPVVGVTGGIGSGKTAVTDMLQQLGVDVVDADLAARAIMEPGRPALAAVRQHFGDTVLLADGTLDRAALRKIVFADPDQRRWLEQLTHPLIGEEIGAQLAAATSPYVVLASPLLLETSQRELCDLVVVVDVPEAVQLERTMRRDDNDEAQVRRIMAAQLQRQSRLEQADEVIDNSGDLQALRSQVQRLHKQLLERFSKAPRRAT